MSDRYIGTDFGGTNLRTALIDSSGTILAKDMRPSLTSEGADPPTNQIVNSVRKVCQDAGCDLKKVNAFGICTPGPLDSEKGVVINASNLPHWRNYPLVQILRERLGIPTVIANDANATAMGEKWLGAGRKTDNFLCVTLGTGIGGGAVVNGHLLRGFNNNALEIGHTSIDPINGIPCPCGNKGCIERYASAATFAQRTMDDLRSNTNPSILRTVLNEKATITSKDIYEAALEGDVYALEAFRETGTLLGYGILNAINILNVEVVAFAGGLSLAGDFILQPVRDVVMERGLVGVKEHIRILRTDLGNEAGMLGAAKIAIEWSEGQ